MKKVVIAAVAAALLSGTAVAWAAGGAGGPGGRFCGPQSAQSAEALAARTDARIAGLRAGLKLTPDQEKLWPAVDGALRDAAKDRQAWRTQMRATMCQAGDERPDPITRMRAMADRMTSGAADLRKIADAADPLYKTLDATQKERLDALIHHGMKGFGHGPHDGLGPRDGRGPQRG